MSQSDQSLIGQIRTGITEGRITRADLEKLLRDPALGGRRRPGSMQVLLAIGVLVMYLGVVLVYAVGFADFGNAAQLTTPFAFPALTSVAAAWAHRLRRSYWEREAVTGVALASFIGAALAASAGTADGVTAAWMQGCTLAWIVAGAVAAVLARDLRVPWMLLLGAGMGLLNSSLVRADASDLALRWSNLGLAAAYGGAGFAAFRLSRRVAEMFAAAGTGGAYIATIMAMNVMGDAGHLTWWHVLLSVAVAAAFVIAPAFEMPLMFVAGGLGALLWISMVLPIAAQSAGWALLVVAMGAALVGTGIGGTLIGRRRERRRAAGSG